MQPVRVTLFWTSGIGPTIQADRYIARADEILRKYGMYLDATPGTQATSQFSLNFSDLIDLNYDPRSPGLTLTKGQAALLKLRGLGDAAYRDTQPRLPIFFAKLFGATGYTATETGWWPWCIADVTRPDARPETMIHEIGHAAMLKHYQKYEQTSHNIMSYGTDRYEFLPTQIDQLRSGYFVLGGPPAAGWQNFDYQ
jgi:hypothetical protein